MMRYCTALAGVFAIVFASGAGSAQDFMAEPGASMTFRQHHSVTRKDRQSLGVHAEIRLYIDKK
jgi:hypothetical protein